MKLYETDGHCAAFTATVLSCEAAPDGTYEIVLDRTAFFPEGGGQSSDRGTLGGQPVLRLRTDAERSEVYHTVALPIAPGSQVEGRIDMEKRFSDMQNHTAEHIVSGTVHALYGYDNVGFHMGEEEITMDFSGRLSAKQLAEIERQANRAVYADLPVEISFHEPGSLEGISYRSKKELTSVVRLVEIKGVDRCACCAPHVARTGEIGLIKLISAQNYKGGARVGMLAGSRAFAELSHRFSQVKAVSASLSANPDELEASVARLQCEIGRLKAEKAAARRDYYTLRAEQCVLEAGNALIFEQDGSFEELRTLVNLLTEKTQGICAVCAPDPENAGAYRFVIGSRSADLRPAAAFLRETLGAACGGRREMIQGTAKAAEETLKEAFKRLASPEQLCGGALTE